MDSLFPYLENAILSSEFASLEDQAKAAEFWETPPWAAEAILRAELLTNAVWDPCAGAGIVSESARRAGYGVYSTDLYDWGYAGLDQSMTGMSFMHFLDPPAALQRGQFTVFCNPPFSLAVQFVRHALQLGARKIVCFERFAWWESNDRRDFWAAHPPQRVYVCGDRANCWLGSIPPEERTGGSPTAHAWFVWEAGQPAGPLTGHVWKR